MSKNKGYLFALLYTVITTSSYAAMPPVQPGENIWQLVSQFGFMADVVEQKVFGLSSSKIPCDYEIKQADIPFTITAPGVYCLAEHVTVPQGQSGITIESDSVVLDLNGRSIWGKKRAGTQGIVIDGSSQQLNGTQANIFIRNGTIKGMAAEGVFVSFAKGPIKLQDLKANKAPIFIVGSQGILIEDCECSCECNCTSICTCNKLCFKIYGSQRCAFNNCVAINSNLYGFDITGSQECYFVCSKAFDNTFDGFYAKESQQLFFYQCIAINNKRYGCYIERDCVRNLINECFFIANEKDGSKVQGEKNNVCRSIAMRNIDGFEIDNDLGSRIYECSLVGNERGGKFNKSDPGEGIDNDVLGSKIFANACNANKVNYGGYYANAVLKAAPTASIGYWTNIDYGQLPSNH